MKNIRYFKPEKGITKYVFISWCISLNSQRKPDIIMMIIEELSLTCQERAYN